MATTMYDVIMDLPLFQGISRAQVSAFLEKTQVESINAERGALIRPSGAAGDSLLYVISGTVQMQWTNDAGDIEICFTQGPRSLLGASHLFGMVRQTPYSVRALTKSSFIKIDKMQYLDLLQTQHVYLLNFINYLSLRAQKPLSQLAAITDDVPLSLLRTLIGTVTPTTAADIELKLSVSTLSRSCNMETSALRLRLEALERRGLIKLGKDSIAVSDRSAFLS